MKKFICLSVVIIFSVCLANWSYAIDSKSVNAQTLRNYALEYKKCELSCPVIAASLLINNKSKIPLFLAFTQNEDEDCLNMSVYNTSSCIYREQQTTSSIRHNFSYGIVHTISDVDYLLFYSLDSGAGVGYVSTYSYFAFDGKHFINIASKTEKTDLIYGKNLDAEPAEVKTHLYTLKGKTVNLSAYSSFEKTMKGEERLIECNLGEVTRLKYADKFLNYLINSDYK